MRGNRRSLLAALLGAVLACLQAGPGAAGIATDPASPAQGEPARILISDDDGVPLSGIEVTALYRPGSEVENLEAVGTTGADGSVPWTPRDAGLVSLRTLNPADSSSQSTNLAIRYQGVPTPGLAIMILAGLVLFGGVIRGFRSLQTPPPGLPPDT